MTVLEMTGMGLAIATPITGALVGFWRIGQWFSRADVHVESLIEKLKAIQEQITALEERTNKRMDALNARLADDIRPLAQSIADLRTKMEDIRVEHAQSTAKFEAARAREETIRLQLQILTDDVKDLASRIDRVEQEGEA